MAFQEAPHSLYVKKIEGLQFFNHNSHKESLWQDIHGGSRWISVRHGEKSMTRAKHSLHHKRTESQKVATHY